MRVKANGISFNCEIDGREGTPWIVFSNSLMTDLSMWDDQVAALKGEFRILRYDQRGHGGTEAPTGAYKFQTLVADVVALFDALEIRRTHFVGLSMGGMTAIALAEQHAERLNRVVACDCGPNSTPQSAQQWEERIAIAEAKGMEGMAEPTVTRWCGPEFLSGNPNGVNRLRQMIRTTPLNGFVGCARALSDFDLRPDLPKIKTPIQFICGGKDASLPGTKALHAAIAGSAFLEIPGAGHISNVEQPELVNRTVRNFLRG
ncbi:MAG TPA: alpha/beta fold hydrolase [Micropepsaceae bacterium]|nr:alpha/beta fold hydrolase [Micropepsaceae bacterium]